MERERYFDDHAPIGIGDRRHEDRQMLYPRMLLHLGDMLVSQAERIDTCGRRPVGALELGDHRFAATRIARDRVDRDRPVDRDQPRAQQRADERQEAGRIAAGIADAHGLGDGRSLARFQLGKAIGPPLCDAVRSGGVDHAGVRIVDQPDSLACRIVGKAEDDEVGVVERFRTRAGILAPVLVEGDQLDVHAPGEPLAYFEAGRPDRAIDEDADAHGAGRTSESAFTYPTRPCSSAIPQALSPASSRTSKITWGWRIAITLEFASGPSRNATSIATSIGIGDA